MWSVDKRFVCKIMGWGMSEVLQSRNLMSTTVHVKCCGDECDDNGNGGDDDVGDCCGDDVDCHDCVMLLLVAVIMMMMSLVMVVTAI